MRYFLWFCFVNALSLAVVGCERNPPKSTQSDGQKEHLSGTKIKAPLTLNHGGVRPSPIKSAPSVNTAPSPGPEVCADCHPSIVEGFLETGMGHSLYRPKARPPIESFDTESATVIHPKTGVTYRAFVDAEGRYWQEETLAGTDYRRIVEATHVIGSGNHTRSYLGVVDGRLVELPLTWYSERKVWAMSPGYEVENHRRFSRPIKPICLFCHNDPTPLRPGKMASYAEPLALGITCARCHGNGAEHVAIRAAGRGGPAGAKDPTILNPKRLSQKRQLQICQQCHLAGAARILMPGQKWTEYDPRSPLADFMSLYVPKEASGPAFGIASHGHRLAMSPCAKASGDKLTCTTCHNPHRRDAEKEKNNGCLSCHSQKDCGDKHRIDGQTCASCHMKRGGTSDIPHVTFTDHFIRKNPTANQDEKPSESVELVDVLSVDRTQDNAVNARVRLGVAHARIWRLDGKEAHRKEAKRILTENLTTEPSHGTGWEELAMIHKSLGNFPAAIHAFKQARKHGTGAHSFRIDEAEAFEGIGDLAAAESVLRALLKQHSDDRAAWGNLGNILLKMGRLDDAEMAYEQSDKFGPSEALTASNRGYLELQRRRYDEAGRWFREALRRDGTRASMYANLGTLALAKGEREKAKKFYEQALERDAKFGIAYWMLGRMAMEKGQWTEARSSLERMIEVSPQDIRGYLDLAGVYSREGAYNQGLRTLLQALQTFPNHPDILKAMIKIRSLKRAVPK